MVFLHQKMLRVPARKFLFFLIHLAIFTLFIYTYNSWAYLQEMVERYHLTADKFQSEGKIDQAIEYYKKTLELDKRRAAAYNGLGICFERKGWLRRAEEEYLQALKVDPQYPPAHYNLGLFYERYGDIRKAILHWRQRALLGRPAEPGRLKARAKLEKYAPEELQDIDARELTHEVTQQREEVDWRRISGKIVYKTQEEKIQDYYLEGIRFYQSGDYRRAEESFHRMIDTLPISRTPVKK